MNQIKILSIILILCSANFVFAGVTGKIAGTIIDADNGQPLPGANIIIEGTMMGAASNLQGYYVILNIPPGTYTLRASMMGYVTYMVKDVRINIDLTTTLDFRLKSEVLVGEEVTVVAERPIVQKDVSASLANIEVAQIEALPVQTVTGVIGLEAGIRGMEIRGGGEDETAFMIDGFTLRDERNNKAYTGISLSAIKDIQIQTGGFNAEYGNIRSGIVNVVTKEGERDQYSGTFTYRNSPAAKKHFGPSGYDPFSYWNRSFLDDAVCWTGTAVGEPYDDLNSNGAWDTGEPFVDYNADGERTYWDEYMQDQYPQFEGWNAVSELSLQNKDPNDDLTPEAAQRVYKWQHRKQGDIKRPDFSFDAGFGGPVPFIGKDLGDLRFFLSYRQEQDEYLIPLARDGYNDNITQLKLTSNITSSKKLTISALYGEIHAVNDNNLGLSGYYRYPYEIADEMGERSYVTGIMYGNDYWCPTHIYRHMFSAKYTNTVSARTFYEVSLERMGNIYKTFPNAERDTTKIVKIGANYWLTEAPYGAPLEKGESGFGSLNMGFGMSNSRDYSKLFTTTARFQLTSQINANNQLKTGAEIVVNEHNIEYGGIDPSLPSGRPWSSWKKTPYRMGAYIQDKIEFKGLIANLGLRFDYSHAGGEWYDLNVYDPAFYSSNYNKALDDQLKKEETKPLYYLSPRLGISHPITENSKLYFNYGHFRSMPEARTIFEIQRATEGNVILIGDPNNSLSKTVAYELGYEHNLFNQFLLRVAAYYKDVSNNVPDRRDSANRAKWIKYENATKSVNYFKAEDNFYEDIRGFEISLKRSFGTWVTGFINYTYMVQTSGYFGKLEYYENPALQRQYDSKNEYQEKPLSRPYLRANVVFNTPSDFGPNYSGITLLGDWRMSLLFDWREGRYDTWRAGLDRPDILYNVQWPDYYNLDIRLSKNLRFGRYEFEFFLDIENTLNTKIFSEYAFSDGNDRKSYFDSLHWPKEIGGPLGYQYFGDDKIGDLRPDDVPYDPMEANPNNDPEIAARNQKRIDTKSYINNPNLEWLYYLNPRDIFFGIRVSF